MPKPVKQMFTLPTGQEITSVVVDEDDFQHTVNQLRDIYVMNQQKRVDDAQINALLKAKHIPMISKGTLTASIFDKYGITTDLACVIVRGQGSNVISQYMGNAHDTN
jgi:uncharacterized protein involved in tellurium resistance